jgi:hypothetical protein
MRHLRSISEEHFALALKVFALAKFAFALALKVFALAKFAFALALKVFALAKFAFVLALKVFELAQNDFALALKVFGNIVKCVFVLKLEIDNYDINSHQNNMFLYFYAEHFILNLVAVANLAFKTIN